MTEPTPDPDGWVRNRIVVRAPAYMAALGRPWLLPDPNPFPTMRLFTLRRKAKR